MGFIKKLLGIADMADAPIGSKILVVDTHQYSGANRGNQAASPRENLDVLQQLERISKREKIRMHVILIGEELRKVKNGDSNEGITVFYAKDTAVRPDTVLRQARAARRLGSVIVVTADRNLEERASDSGIETLRSDTFRKGFDAGGGGGGGGNRRPNRNRRRSGGDGQRSGDGGEGKGGGRGENSGRKRPQQRRQAPKKPASDPVSDLIDLVD